MKSNHSSMRTLAILGGLAISTSAASAGAVRIYFTTSADPAGLTDPSLAFKNTGGNGTDRTDYALNGELPAVGVPTIDASIGQFLYLWVAFEDEPNSRKIQGMNLTIDNDEWETARGIYLGDDAFHGESLRWNLGSQTTDPMVLVAIQEPGIVNRKSDGWLYYGGDTRTALLGAVAFSADFTGEVRLGLSKQGVSYSGQSAPKIKFGGNEEELEPDPFWGMDVWSTDADAVVVPEPALAFPLLLAAVARLRRR